MSLHTKNRGLIQAPGQMAYMDVYGSSTSSCIGAQQKTAVRPGHITCPGVQHSTTPHTVFGLCIESVIHVCASFTLIDVIISPFTYCVNRFLKKIFVLLNQISFRRSLKPIIQEINILTDKAYCDILLTEQKYIILILLGYDLYGNSLELFNQ